MALLSRKKTKKVIAFLCTGDTCRGPMAKGYMKKALEERGITNVEVKSAGVMTVAGLKPTAEAIQVMTNATVDINLHRSSALTNELIRRADLLLGMTPFHVQHAVRMSEDAKGKTYLLKEFAGSDMKNYQISDPMGATLEVYKRVYRETKLAIDKMLAEKDFFKDDVEEVKVETKAPVVEAEAPAPVAPRKTPAPAKVVKGATAVATKPAAAKAAPTKKGEAVAASARQKTAK